MRKWLTTAVVVALVSLTGYIPAGAQHEQGYKLIVHPGNAVETLERKFVEDAFLKKVTKWPSGRTLQPVDAKVKSQVRRFFSESVMKRSAAAVRNYWQVQVFGGRDIPPPELSSDDDIIAYVSKRPGAIGYISIYAELDDTRVRVVRVK